VTSVQVLCQLCVTRIFIHHVLLHASLRFKLPQFLKKATIFRGLSQMQVKSPGLKSGSVKVLLAMCTEYETDENVETVIVKKMLHILKQGEKWVFVLDRWVFVLDQWVFVLDRWVFVLLQVGLRFRPVGLRFRPVGLRFRPVGLRFRPVGLRFRPQGLRSSVFVFGSSFSTHPWLNSVDSAPVRQNNTHVSHDITYLEVASSQ